MLKRSDYTYLLVSALGFACILAASFYWNNYYLQVATTLAMFSSLALGWNIVGGYMGYPSLATAALFGLGVYVSAICQVNGLPLSVSWLLAAAFSLLFSILIGLVLLRLRGHYFAIGAVGAVGVLNEIASNWNSLTGGSIGLNLPLISGTPEYVSRFFFTAMLGLTAISLLTVFVVDRTRLGFGLRCIRQNESAASMIGLNVFRYKVIAFALSSVIAGVAGAIYASMIGFIEPQDAFNIQLSIEVPVMAMIGGMGTVAGPLVGSAVYLILREIVRASLMDWHDAALGVLVVLVIYFLPKGLLNIPWPRKTRDLNRERQTPKADQGVHP